jgi:thioredoxin 1
MKIRNILAAAALTLLAAAVTTSCSKRAEQNQAEETESATGEVDPEQIGEAVHIVKAGEEIYPVEGKLVVVDFNATWCGPCRQFGPVFEAVAAGNADKALFYSVDVDQNPELAGKFGVESIPMVVYMTPDGEFTSTVGYMDEATFASTLASKLLK